MDWRGKRQAESMSLDAILPDPILPVAPIIHHTKSHGLLGGAHGHRRVLLAARGLRRRLARLLVLVLARLGHELGLIFSRGLLEQLAASLVLEVGSHLHRDEDLLLGVLRRVGNGRVRTLDEQGDTTPCANERGGHQ